MRTKFTSVYATLVIGYLEENYINRYIKYGSQYVEEFIHNWKSFLDDCFIPWTFLMTALFHGLLYSMD